ncbi:hypothetical protein SNEBB_004812 [Seison nebaliae]|nr:hypothetical protein SNEBB_004812 [Seison nebaliae]
MCLDKDVTGRFGRRSSKKMNEVLTEVKYVSESKELIHCPIIFILNKIDLPLSPIDANKIDQLKRLLLSKERMTETIELCGKSLKERELINLIMKYIDD